MSKAEMSPVSCVRTSPIPRIGCPPEQLPLDFEPVTQRPGELEEDSDSDREILPSDIAELRRWGLT